MGGRFREKLFEDIKPALDTRDPEGMLKMDAEASSIAAAQFQRAGDDLHRGFASLNLAEALDVTEPGGGKEARTEAGELLPASLAVKIATL